MTFRDIPSLENLALAFSHRLRTLAITAINNSGEGRYNGKNVIDMFINTFFRFIGSKHSVDS